MRKPLFTEHQIITVLNSVEAPIHQRYLPRSGDI